jgi:hypothetical protein
MEILPFCVPLAEALSVKSDRLAAGAPIQLVIELEVIAGPVASEKRSILLVDNVFHKGQG